MEKKAAFDYLHRAGVFGGKGMPTATSDGIAPAPAEEKLKIYTKAIGAKREPEYPSDTTQGPREGWNAGRAKSSSGESVRTKDGWEKPHVDRNVHDGWKPRAERDSNDSVVASAKMNKTPSDEANFKGLKGSKKKILEEGHNTKGDIPRVSSVKAAKKEVKVAKKTGGDVAAAKANVKVQKGERKAAFGELKRAQHELQAKGAGEGRKKFVKAAKANLKQNYSGAFKAQRAKAEAAEKKKKEGGGLFGGIMGAAKKGAMPWS